MIDEADYSAEYAKCTLASEEGCEDIGTSEGMLLESCKATSKVGRKILQVSV